MAHTSFTTTLADANVSHASRGAWLPLLGLMLWSIPAGLYSYGLYHAITEDEQPAPRVLWALMVGLHAFTGILVYVDVRWYGGLYWPLQTFVIGLALFNTLSLPVLSAHYIVRDDVIGTGVALGALGFVCLSDASMVAILFELFHRRLRMLGDRTVAAPPPARSIKILEMTRSQSQRR